MAILVAGGAGYIGSHTCVQLLNSGYEAVVVDNLYNSKIEAIRRVEKITGKKIKFYHVDVCDRFALREIFEWENIEAVIHFAAYKAVGESVSKPLEYYSNNLISTLTLLETMKEYRVRNFVFSSSATVYGDPETVPIRENFPTTAANPYGRTKLMNEHILMDFYHACPDMNIAILRYFNPIGAHKSGLIGEDPNDIPNNLVPYITQVAAGKLEKLQIFGNDYKTKDGTGVRDYIHVVDLADGHISALEKLKQNCGLVVYNLGTGTGYSVLEVVQAFEKVIGRSIPYEFTHRRPGDVAVCYADPSKAGVELGWKAKYKLEEMCRDSWNWQKNNPNGYDS